MSAVPVAAPKTLRYEQDAGLPVAINARSQRRTYTPLNTGPFGPLQNNVIRMKLSSQSFMDFSHSYLQFTVKNVGTRAVKLDLGVPFFSRLQIMSGGEELEDIQEWSRLYAILNSIQGSDLMSNEQSITQHSGYNPVKTTAGAGGALAEIDNTSNADRAAQIATAINLLNPSHSNQTDLANNASVTFNIPLVSAVFNVQKYFPLLLAEQGLDIYLYLNPADDIGAWATGGPAGNGYEISNIRYIAHEVNLDENFTNQMKSSMSATGGLLSMSSTTYRYYHASKAANVTGNVSIPIATRVKSLKGLIVRPQNAAIPNTSFNVGTGQAMGTTSLQFRVGSVLYPQSAVEFSNSNKGELFNEIRKCFGTIGSYNHGTMLNDVTFAQNADDRAAASGLHTDNRSLWVAAYDFETFAKSATESGINVADRALPVSLHLDKTAIATMRDNANGANLTNDTGKIRYDTFAMCDCIIYIDLMGKITTRI